MQTPTPSTFRPSIRDCRPALFTRGFGAGPKHKALAECGDSGVQEDVTKQHLSRIHNPSAQDGSSNCAPKVLAAVPLRSLHAVCTPPYTSLVG